MRILIIEDEYPTALDLKSTLEEINPASEIIGIIDSVEAGIRFFRNNRPPDLAFMDIQLSDGLSLEIFQEAEVRCPVVFCTAYNEYAIQAFKVNGVDYLLKPFDKAAVSRSLDKVERLRKFFQSGEPAMDGVLQALRQLRQDYKTSFLVPVKNKLIPIGVTDIAYFQTSDEVTFLYTTAGNRHMVNHSLEELEKLLDPREFFRINRQYLVHYPAIREVERYFARKLLLRVSPSPKEPLLVSKAKAPAFLEWMEKR